MEKINSISLVFISLIFLAICGQAQSQPGKKNADRRSSPSVSSAESGYFKNPFVYGPGDAKSELKAQLSYSTTKASFSSPGFSAEIKASGYAINLNYAYGLGPAIAFEISQVLYGQYKFENSNPPDSENSGFGSTGLGVKGLIQLPSDFYIGYSTSFVAAILEAPYSNSQTNKSSIVPDQNYISIRISPFIELDNLQIGLPISYNHSLEGSVKSVSTTGIESDLKYSSHADHDIGLFGQITAEGNQYGLLFSENVRKEYQITTASNVTDVSPLTNRTVAAFASFELDSMNGSRIGVTLSKYIPKDQQSGITVDTYNAAVDYRFLF